MNKVKAKSVVALIMCLMMAVTAVQFMFPNENNGFKAFAEKRAEIVDEFLIGSWVSYSDGWDATYAEQTAELARSGLNVVYNPADLDNTQNWTMKLNNMQRYNEIFEANHMYYGYNNPDREALLTEAIINGSDNMKFYYVYDEPSASQFEDVKNQFDFYQNADSSRFAFCNIYPNYAGTRALGGTYEDYVTNYVNTIGADNMEYLSFDHYPFTQASGEGGYRETFFSDFETIRKTAYENDKMKTLGCTQLGQWNGMRIPDINEARWDISMHLAYGVKGLIHFNWIAPKFTKVEDGGEEMTFFPRNYDGTTTEIYEPLQKINWQTRQLGPTFLNLDASHAYHCGTYPAGAEKLPASFFVQPAGNEDFVVTLFTSKDDSEKYIMLTNKSMLNNATATFNIDTSFGIESLTQIKPDDFEILPEVGSELPAPERISKAISGGKITDTFLPGEYKLYKLEGDFEIPDPVQSPVSSLSSGNYTTSQEITLTSTQTDVDYYYTLDGTYPVPESGSAQKYSSRTPIVLGTQAENKLYTLRVVGKRGKEVSLPNDYYYFIDTTANKGTQLIGTSATAWTENGGSGNWTIADDNITMKGGYSSSMANRSLTYNAQKYGNMVVEMTYKIDSDTIYPCHPGIGLFKKTPQSSLWTPDDGYYAILEHAGRIGVYDGSTEYGPRNVAATNYDAAQTGVLKVVVVDDFISISVNDKTAYTIRDPRIKREEGYIAILAAQIPIKVTSFTVKALTDCVNGKSNDPEYAILSQSTEMGGSFELYTSLADVVSELPTAINVLNSAGDTVSANVSGWNCATFDRKSTLTYMFTAQFANLPSNLVNVFNVKPEYSVRIARVENNKDLVDFITLAKSLNKTHFTSESWANLEIFIETAEEIAADRLVAANQITVASMRLYNALQALENIVTDKTALNQTISNASAKQSTDYTPDSFNNFTAATAKAQTVAAQPYATQAQIDSARDALSSAVTMLVYLNDAAFTQQKTELETALTTAKALIAANYTTESYSALSGCLDAAQAAIDAKDGAFYAAHRGAVDAAVNMLIKKADIETKGAVGISSVKNGLGAGQIMLIILGAVFAVAAVAAVVLLKLKKLI